MASAGEAYSGPLLKARPERGEVIALTGQSFWLRTTSDDEAEHKPFWTLNEALAWITTGDIAIVSGVSDCEAHWTSVGSDGPIAAWFQIDQDAQHYQHGADRSDGLIYVAADHLRDACERGEVEAFGVCPGSDAREPVPSVSFCNGLLGPGNGGQLSRQTEHSQTSINCHSLRFRASQVTSLQLFEAPIRSGGRRPRGRPKGDGFQPADRPYFERMQPLVAQGWPVTTAAREVTKDMVAEAASTTTERLRKSFAAWQEYLAEK